MSSEIIKKLTICFYMEERYDTSRTEVSKRV